MVSDLFLVMRTDVSSEVCHLQIHHTISHFLQNHLDPDLFSSLFYKLETCTRASQPPIAAHSGGCAASEPGPNSPMQAQEGKLTYYIYTGRHACDEMFTKGNHRVQSFVL